jgi:hypothetical protein
MKCTYCDDVTSIQVQVQVQGSSIKVNEAVVDLFELELTRPFHLVATDLFRERLATLLDPLRTRCCLRPDCNLKPPAAFLL